ncbi:hypothetical protein SEA_BING_67 [Streptomyces phage Bing]|uniref:Uncharacterized protein n=1 Tax=Streptomyces phage Bing TaxID=2079427 RepID=A0A2L1IWC4_9CAUD|nr:hypothetical protein FDJ31_gp67 [Streptomyces phage Bing]AVD99489.1 hypothetical protein SEA_BING_67 [Streptomyces phage Bing]
MAESHIPEHVIDEQSSMGLLHAAIQDGLIAAADAAHEAVMQQIEEDIAGGTDHFIGLAGLTREVLETDAEDHIIRGTD